MRRFIKIDMYKGSNTLLEDPDPSTFIGMVEDKKGYGKFTSVWHSPGWMIIEIPRQLHEPVRHTMNLAGKQVVDYGIECFQDDTKEELLEEAKARRLCFTYAEFDNGNSLTDDQLSKLSKKYPAVIQDLIETMD